LSYIHTYCQVVVVVAAVVIPTASACIFPLPSTIDLISSSNARHYPRSDAIIYQLNAVSQVAPAFRYLLQSHVGDTIRLTCSSTLAFGATRIFFFQYPFLHSDLFPLLVPLLYHMCHQPKITNANGFFSRPFLHTISGFCRAKRESNGDMRRRCLSVIERTGIPFPFRATRTCHPPGSALIDQVREMCRCIISS